MSPALSGEVIAALGKILQLVLFSNAVQFSSDHYFLLLERVYLGDKGHAPGLPQSLTQNRKHGRHSECFTE